MFKPDWYELAEGADVLMSSLCVHHLTGTEKKALFHAVYKGLSERGALLLADLVQPACAEVRELFAATWDRAAEAQARELGEAAAYEAFQREHWNYYRYPDPFDKPSGLFEQLTWLKQAGFATVDCFWMFAGHAIYGGYKQESSETFAGIPVEEALHVANLVLEG
jgi:tRNA (cmo5U34)-methyltransferase